MICSNFLWFTIVNYIEFLKTEYIIALKETNTRYAFIANSQQADKRGGIMQYLKNEITKFTLSEISLAYKIGKTIFTVCQITCLQVS